jgi:hypothetical protein
MSVEVVIERHACPPFFPRKVNNVLVLGAAETHLGYVDSVPTIEPEQRGRVRREALIQHNPIHAT